MLKAVLFDMDGVIVDTEPLHHKAYHKMFADYKINVTSEMYESFTGGSTINVCKKIVDTFNLDADPQDLVLCKRKHFFGLFENDESLKLIDGVEDLIKDYHSNGLTLVLASSASMGTIDAVFNRFNLNQYFVAKLSGADLKQSKPHPEIFTNAAKAAGEDANKCMVIEDSTNGIKAANSANIYCVGFKSVNSKNQDYSTADLKITDFDEISFNKIKSILN